ncbi:MAG: ABC transporter permease subunit [Rickettsiaceae bacterium]|nr:MAG: ABC transporter permease subunit [Rickettsiaceae bacterium]
MISSLYHRHRKVLNDGQNISYKSVFLNIIAFLIVNLAVIFVAWGVKAMSTPIEITQNQTITLLLSDLFFYSLRTLLRMLIAIVISVIVALPLAVIIAKSAKVEQILLPMLDVLQSVPILGYISFTVTTFLALFPGQNTGAEMAAIFAIFTSQVWNIIFSFHQSLKSLPQELKDTAQVFNLTRWQKFWRMELPFGIPSLVWNIVLSMSSGWFYVVASEVIVVGNNNITLPGIGSYISLAIAEQNVSAVINAVVAMTIIILIYDQLIFRPLVVWSDKFRYETTTTDQIPKSWIFELFVKSILVSLIVRPILILVTKIIIYWPHKIAYAINSNNQHPNIASKTPKTINHSSKIANYIWYGFLAMSTWITLYYIVNFVNHIVGFKEVLYVMKLGAVTLARVFCMVLIAAIIWVPIGIKIGLNSHLTKLVQPIAQFLASFPINIFFPIVVTIIINQNLNPDIWLSPLIIIGSQWYILFNIIAGVSTIPNDLKEVAKNLHVEGYLSWKKLIIPSIIPHFITGAITASGAAWNASIIAEYVVFGHEKITAYGLGSYITEQTIAADFNKIALGVSIMAFYVILLNKLFWQPLNNYSKKKFKF